ncbi:MAG TPA: phage Gp37/Gp68 family protein [Nannocystis sp.]
MSEHDTGIEWTHVPGYKGSTWNPIRGCVKVSPGCKHCYAETFAERWRGVSGHPYEQGFDLRLVPEKLDEPLRASSPRAYFVNSMSDLHQPGVPFDFIVDVYNTMAKAERHLFMVLTKRAAKMRDDILSMKDASFDNAYTEHPLGIPNVWLGVSVEDRKYGVPRVDVLRTIPAAVRFLSCEPLLEDLGDLDLTGIDWVIIGGESGRKARPFAFEWARRIVAQCREQGVPVFVKQPGDNPTANGGLVQVRSKSDRVALAIHGLDVREWPRAVTSPR